MAQHHPSPVSQPDLALVRHFEPSSARNLMVRLSTARRRALDLARSLSVPPVIQMLVRIATDLPGWTSDAA
jgi:hypothetical protein